MSEKPKRRWYQFSLRTMLVMMGAVILVAWGENSRFCMTQIYRYMDDSDEDGGYVHLLDLCDEPYTPDESRELATVNEQRSQITEAYTRAIYRPWERLWIGPEPRPPKKPERFIERLKSCRDLAHRDALLRSLEHPSKRSLPPRKYDNLD